MQILEVNGLRKVYTTRFGGASVEALKNINFSVENGEYVAIMGESGSGKTTLLNILAGLDKPTSGQVLLDGKDLASIRESDRAAFRRDNLGFVFQEFNLLDTFSVQDNIFPRHGRPAARLLRYQCRRPDHPDGHAFRPRSQPCGPGPVHQGRRGLPPALPRRHDRRSALPEDHGRADRPAGGRRAGMTHRLYPRLAWQGITKNKRLYLPFLLTCVGMVMMTYILL